MPALPERQSQTLVRDRRESASFGDLVHTRWDCKRNPTDETARRRYEEI